MVWNSSSHTLRKMGLYSPLKWWKDSKISVMSRGIQKKKNNRDTIRFNADASNTELLFRIMHSVNQLSIYGAVSNWCEHFGFTEEENGQEQQKESMAQRCTDKRQTTRSKTFGIFSKTSTWKQSAENHSGLRITVRNNSIDSQGFAKLHRSGTGYQLV